MPPPSCVVAARRRRRLRLAAVLSTLAAIVLTLWGAATVHVLRGETTRSAPQRQGEDERRDHVLGKPAASTKKKNEAPPLSGERKVKESFPHHRKKRRRTKRTPTAAPTRALAAGTVFPFSRRRRKATTWKATTQLYFRVAPRKDLENFVAPLLRSLGLVETRGMDWDLYVGLQFKPEREHNYLLAPEGALISSMPGLKETLGDKEAFARLWRICVDDGGLCEWTVPSYNFAHKVYNDTPSLAVEGGALELLEHLPRHSPLPSTWIVKPQRRYLSLGMHLATLTKDSASSLANLARWASVEVPAAETKRKHHTEQPGEFTIQRYVERPALLGRRKFDLRLWVLIASLDPLSIFILDVAFPKVSVQDYRFAADTLQEKCMHILMMVSEFCTRHVQSFPVYPFAYPATTLSRSFQLNLFNDSASELNNTWLRWQTELWPALERTVLAPLLLAVPELRRHEQRVFQNFTTKRQHRFALLSPDAVYDADANRWRLEEINTNGLFQLGADDPDQKTFHRDDGYTEGWLHVVGATGFPLRPSYQSRLDARLDDFCRRSSCDDQARQALERSFHQSAHVSAGWYRLYPGRFPLSEVSTDLDHLHHAFLAENAAFLASLVDDDVDETTTGAGAGATTTS